MRRDVGKTPSRQGARLGLALLNDIQSALPTDLLAKGISGRIDPIDAPGIDSGIVDPDGCSKPVAGDGKSRRIRPLREPRYHPDVLDGPAFENPAEMNFARSFMARAIGRMGDDPCLPIPNEPAIKLQLFRSIRCGLLGMQNGNQLTGGYVHRALPRFCELDETTRPALKLG